MGWRAQYQSGRPGDQGTVPAGAQDCPGVFLSSRLVVDSTVCLEWVLLQTLSQVVAPSRCPGAVQHTLGPFSGRGCPRDAPGVPLPGWGGLCWKPLLVDLTGRPPARALASSCGVRRTHWPPWAQHLPPGCGHRSPAGLGAHWAAACGKRAGPERGHGQEGQVTLDRAGGERTSCGGRSSDVHSVLLFMEGL